MFTGTEGQIGNFPSFMHYLRELEVCLSLYVLKVPHFPTFAQCPSCSLIFSEVSWVLE